MPKTGSSAWNRCRRPDLRRITDAENWDLPSLEHRENWLFCLFFIWGLFYLCLARELTIDNCLSLPFMSSENQLFLLWVPEMFLLLFLPWASETVSFAFSEGHCGYLFPPFGKMIFNGSGYKRLVRKRSLFWETEEKRHHIITYDICSPCYLFSILWSPLALKTKQYSTL